MNTKTFNHFRNTFAFIGFFIIACSVGTVEDETPEVEPPVVQNNIGKYQMSQGDEVMVVINTESGKIKTYVKDYGGGTFSWTENTNGALTVSH